jgi:outer membrane protein insertion porin family
VKYFQPTVEYKQFWPINRIRVGDKPTVLGFRVLGGNVFPFGSRFNSNSLSFISGVPIASRFFLGGEETIRGFNIVSVSPVARIDTFLTTRNVKAVTGANSTPLPVLPDNGDFTGGEVAQSVINQFTFTGRTGSNQLLTGSTFRPIGGDTQLLFNGEYRIPLFGPVNAALFFDIGSAFNLRKLEEQTFETNFTTTALGTQVVNPFGRLATAQEINAARTPETPPLELPPGFTGVNLTSEGQQLSVVNLQDAIGGIFDNYRASLGTEVRVQVPVINVPFRLIFAYNPNARTRPGPTTIFLEEKFVFRFSIGRTF